MSYSERHYDDDRSEFQDPGGRSALRRATWSNPRIYPCPTLWAAQPLDRRRCPARLSV